MRKKLPTQKNRRYLPHKKQKYDVIKWIMGILLLQWFTIITFFQQDIVKGDIDSKMLIFAPSFVAFVLLLLILSYIYFVDLQWRKINIIMLQGPALIYGLFLIFAGISLIFTKYPLDGYGYLIAYIIAYSNIFIIYVLYKHYKEYFLLKHDEDIIYYMAYLSGVIILIGVAYFGGNLLFTEKRLEFILKASGLGLVALTVIIYPIAFRWTVMRALSSSLAIFILIRAGSRSAILGVFFAIILCFIMKYGKSFFFIIAVTLLLIICYCFSDILWNVSENILLLHDPYRGIDKLSSRVNIWYYCWDIFLENPFFGIGFRTSEKYLSDLIGGSAHNIYLTSLVETGIIGTFIMFFAVFSALWILGKAAWQERDRISLFLVSLLVASLVFGVGERFLINIGNVSSLLCMFALFHASNITWARVKYAKRRDVHKRWHWNKAWRMSSP